MDAENLLAALGGRVNITSVETAITRLRVAVVDSRHVDERAVRECGAIGVVVQRGAVQVILGPATEEIAAALMCLLPGQRQL
ncbi:glucose PTS transporter subunit EIIB [Trueperella sp. LYQ143]|uniref:glucose PTS transporter subunit EIIB n=1 Tax=unclassified Trueperella TaxID=2630174 RepID=UPI003983B813